MFNSMDTDHDDVIAYSEFLAAAMQAMSTGECESDQAIQSYHYYISNYVTIMASYKMIYTILY